MSARARGPNPRSRLALPANKRTELVGGHFGKRSNLREQCDLLQSTLDTVDNLIVGLDRHGCVMLINRYGAELIGLPARKIIGKNWFYTFLGQQEETAEVFKVFQAIVSGRRRQVEYFENSIVTAVKGVRRIAWHNTELRNATGRIVGTLSSGTDITDVQQAEIDLRNSLEELQRAQFIGCIGSWHLDAVTLRLTWSAETYHLFGIAPGTPMSYATFVEVVHPLDRTMVEACWQAALHGEPYDIEHRILVDGQVRWMRERAELEFDADGQVFCAHGTVQDVTDRKQASLALIEREQTLRYAQEIARIGVFTYALAEDRWNCSAVLESLCGIAADFPRTAASWLSLMHPEDRPLMSAYLDEIIRGERSMFDKEYRIQRQNDGLERWMHGFGQLEISKSDGRQRLVGVIKDITERKLAELSLVDARRQYQLLFHASPLAMWVIDRETLHIREINQAAINEYGYSREELLGMRLLDILPLESHAPAIQRISKQGFAMRGEVVQHIRKNGDNIQVKIWSESIQYQGRPARLAISQNVTQQLQLEADQREKIALAEQLTQVAATVPGAIFSFLLWPDGSCAMPYLAGRLVDAFGVDAVQLREDARPVFDFLIPEELPSIWQSIERSASTLQPWGGVYRARSPKGGLRWIEIASIPQRHPDGGVLWHGYISDVTERTEAAQLVAQSRDQLKALATRVEQVREDERRRISRELHDDLGQMLTSIKMHLRRFVSSLQYIDQSLAREMIDVVRMTDETTNVVRRIVHELRPKILDTLDLGSAIAWEVGEFRKRLGSVATARYRKRRSNCLRRYGLICIACCRRH